MELTRRDALVAVAASTGGVAIVGEIAESIDGRSAPADRVERVLSGLEAAAVAIYPTDVSVTEPFLRTYVLGRAADSEGYLENATEALDYLDGRSRREFNRPFRGLTVPQRESMIRSIGKATISPNPEGSAIQRARYYVLEELLYALYTSPTGGRLLGTENPPGHPGGRNAYQRGPRFE